MDAQNYQNLYPKAFDFCGILKMCGLFRLLYFYIVQREDDQSSQIEPQLTVKIMDRHYAPLKA